MTCHGVVCLALISRVSWTASCNMPLYPPPVAASLKTTAAGQHITPGAMSGRPVTGDLPADRRIAWPRCGANRAPVPSWAAGCRRSSWSRRAGLSACAAGADRWRSVTAATRSRSHGQRCHMELARHLAGWEMVLRSVIFSRTGYTTIVTKPYSSFPRKLA